MTATVIVFFYAAITVGNETDFWQAGKYPLLTMHVQNVQQLAGEKILKRHTKRATTDTHIFICPTSLSRSQQAGGKEKQKSKRKNQRKVKEKEKP